MNSFRVLVVTASCVSVGMSLSAPEAHASPRGKIYEVALIPDPTPGFPVCTVFHSDGSFSFAVIGLTTTGAWFETGGLWFSFSTPAPGSNLLLFFVGTTFGADSEVLVAAGLTLGALFPPAFLVAGQSTNRCNPNEARTTEASARRPGTLGSNLGRSNRP
jgi:hypothetical protein